MHNDIRQRVGRSAVRRAAGFFAPFVAAFLLSVSGVGHAQTLPNINAGELSQLQQQLQQSGQGGTLGSSLGGGLNGTLNTQIQPDITLRPDLTRPVALPPSRLEQIMSQRAGAQLRQFGYDQFGSGRTVTIPQSGAVQDDYVLGPGDQIIVSLRGQENGEFQTMVDRNGQVIIPRLSPIAATGRTFGSFRQDLEAAVQRAYVATQAFVSVGRVRQISVLVSGEVNNPGVRLVPGLASAVDALLLSGGIKKTGSLRNVRILRGGHEYTVDLYSVLTTGGDASSLRLADGDRILVPPLGQTVAVAGLVRRPGIFELPPRQDSISVAGALALAGGEEVRGRYRVSVMHIDPDGRSTMAAMADEKGTLRDSEILFVQLGADQTVAQATLSGGTGLAGGYPITQGTKLSDVLRAPGALGGSPYTLFGIIVRKDPRTLLRSLVAFTPVSVLVGTEDQNLQTDDVIRILSVNETQLLGAVVRYYLSRLAIDQANIRNPLDTQNSASDATQSGTTAANAAANAVGVNAGANANTNNRNDANARGTPLSSDPSELAYGLEDVTSVPADVQRAEITALLNATAPGAPVSPSQSRARDRDQTGGSQNSANPADNQTGNSAPTTADLILSGVSNGQFGAGMTDANGNSTNATGAPDQNSGYGDMRQRPLPDNFQEQPVGPSGYASNREVKTFGELSRQLGVDPLVLVNFLIDHRARLDGAVQGPGSYFVGPNVPLADLVQAAGGTVDWADQSGVELITTAVDSQSGHAMTQRENLPLKRGMLASYIVQPRDQLRFNRVFTDVGVGAATVQGEVRFAGSYPILRGEHLSDLLARAGGLTSSAYPAGTVFLRKSAAEVEHDGYVRAANEVQDQLLVGMTRVGNDKIPPETFSAMQGFVTQLRTQKALGRVSITADPSLLAAKPELDPLLEAGDVIYIPQRPSTVSVLGQVMQPGSYAYRAGESLGDYIQQAGGYAQYSDESLTFIVLPDGSARKVEKSWLGFDSTVLPPGSAIVVPRDLTPLDTRQVILDVTGVMSQLAISLASLAVISNN